MMGARLTKPLIEKEQLNGVVLENLSHEPELDNLLDEAKHAKKIKKK